MDGTDSSPQQHGQRAVFLGPTRLQIDASWNIRTAPTASDPQQVTYDWKVRWWRDDVLLESRDHYQCCPTTQPTNTCPHDCPYKQMLEARVATRHTAEVDSSRKTGEAVAQAADAHKDDDARTTVTEGDAPQERLAELTEATSSRSGVIESELDSVPERPTKQLAPAIVQTSPQRDRPTHSDKSKKSRMVLGQARRVGLSRNDRPNLLKTLEAKRAGSAAETAAATTIVAEREDAESVTTLSSVGQYRAHSASISGLIGNESAWGGTAVDSIYSLDSIAPPPVHRFSLSSLTAIATLLSRPNDFLGELQGGNHVGRAPRISLVALVHRIDPVSEVLDRKAKDGRMMKRCDIILCDRNGAVLNVRLEGSCASRWALEGGAEEVHGNESHLAYRPRLRSARRQSFIDDRFEDSAAVLRQQNANKLFPVREGDVVALTGLRVTKTNHNWRPKGNDGWPRAADAGGVCDHIRAVASNSTDVQPTMDLCWRNKILEEPRDSLLNFDRAVAEFDARCRTILDLADAWVDPEETT